jgi:hypothetical protein
MKRKASFPFAFLSFFRNFARKMKKISFIILLLAVTLMVCAQPASDPRSLQFMGIPLEGHIDSLNTRLAEAEFTEWGRSDDGEDYYYRGKFYGIRAKLLVSISTQTHFVESAYITVGPYSTKSMFEKNFQYFLYKLQKDYGEFTKRDDAWYYMDDFGSVKMSEVQNENGSLDIRVFYYPSSAYYKDALTMGLHGPVQEIVTENAVAEDQFLRFSQNGQLENPDMVNREYDRHGYLLRARMTEKEGYSDVEFTYDSRYRLIRRTLTNATANIRYVNEYTYNDQDEIMSQNQKVFDKTGQCVMTINMHNSYLTRDDYGNWTSNSMTLSYWEEGSQSQQTTVLQKRVIEYWE